MTGRLIVVIVILTTTGVGVRWLSRPESVLERASLQQLPVQVGAWQGEDQLIDPKVLQVLGVNDHVNRVYTSDGMLPVSLYIGFYASQRTGQTIHSPMKCLPGNGWQPIATGLQDIDVGGDPASRIRVNRYIVQNDAQRYVVLFWYQMRGHVVSSEYTAKLYLIDGALRTNRTDGALVRIVVPVLGEGGERHADEVAATFVRALFPRLPAHLPV